MEEKGINYERGDQFLRFARKFEKEFKDDRTPLMYAVKKVGPKIEKAISELRQQADEEIEDANVSLASREEKEKGKPGNIIEEEIILPNTVLTKRRFTPENRKELNEKIRTINKDLLLKDLPKDSFRPHLVHASEYPDLPLEYLEPFYDIVIHRMNEEEEERFFVNKQQEENKT